MGAVYRATDTRLNREVAIKILPSEFAEDAGRLHRFEREARALAALNHPNIAAIYRIEQGAIVMELVAGDDLHGPLPVDTAIDYARQAQPEDGATLTLSATQAGVILGTAGYMAPDQARAKCRRSPVSEASGRFRRTAERVPCGGAMARSCSSSAATRK